MLSRNVISGMHVNTVTVVMHHIMFSFSRNYYDYSCLDAVLTVCGLPHCVFASLVFTSRESENAMMMLLHAVEQTDEGWCSHFPLPLLPKPSLIQKERWLRPKPHKMLSPKT